MLLERTELVDQDRIQITAIPSHHCCSASLRNRAQRALGKHNMRPNCVAAGELGESLTDDTPSAPWNLKTEMLAQLEYARAWGARFVVPITQLEVY